MSSVRKIQLTGGSTYIVSLPSKWVKNNHLTRGSEVKIEESKDRLVLYNSSDVKTEIDKVLNIGQIDTKSLQRALISIYISGFDTLTIRSSNYISDEIRDTIKNFPSW